jgi:hypothetical protein
MGNNLYPHAGMGFLTGRIRVSGCGYGMVLPDGFYPLPSLAMVMSVSWGLRVYTEVIYLGLCYWAMLGLGVT